MKILFFICLLSFKSFALDFLDTEQKKIHNFHGQLTSSKKITIAVIDTGIDHENKVLTSHSRKINGNFGVMMSNPKIAPHDRMGHGSHIAGLIISINKNVELLNLSYYNEFGEPSKTSIRDTIEALRYAIEQDVDIINYSGGGPEPDDEEYRLLKEAERKGIVVVVAMGNERNNLNEKKNYYPASYGFKNLIRVAGLNNEGELLPASNYGSNFVDIFAVGHRVRSFGAHGSMTRLSGTSQATAIVSGAVSYALSEGLKFKDLCSYKEKLLKYSKNGCVLDFTNIMIKRDISSK